MKGAGTLLFTLILSCFSALRCEATTYQSDGSAASVQGLHNAILNGDTITLPAGTFTWTTRVNLTKAITLQGDDVGATIIRDGVQSGSLLTFTLVANRVSRLTGIEFQNGGRSTTANAPGGIFHVNGVSNTNGSQFRMDHCKWVDLNGFLVFDTVLGVIDHTSFITGNRLNLIYIYDSNWNNQGPYGDGSWAAPVNFGSSDFLFFEDDDFHNNNTTYMSYVTDALNGGRYVARHCTLYNCYFTDHGTESGGRERGSRAMEIYNNTFTGTNIGDAIGGSRSSRVVLHDNTVSGFINGGKFTLGNWRNFYSFSPWGGADGTNQWDVNDTGGNNGVFFTGSAVSNSSGTTVTVSGNPNWTSNQWVGYTIRRTSNICNSNTVSFGWIVSSAQNTITYTDNGGYQGPQTLAFCAGDTFEIRKVNHALDQPGRGGGSLITGDPPVRPVGWNNQVTEPCYSWNNGTVGFGSGPGVRANVHYFNNTPMPGYTSYVYPHPLVTGNPPPTPTPTVAPPTLGNISTRSFVRTGDDVMIGGFIVQGTEPKRVIIRAIGPELTQHGVPNALANPTLELHNGMGALIASNNNWATTIIGGIITANQVSAIRNSGYAPSQASESAIIATLPPGNYTAIVSGVNNTTGVALVDVYDLSPDASSILGNISTRGFVQTGDNVMIGGFIIQGTAPKRVIIRAIGPELTQHGVPNALADPTLELHDGTGALIASNHNWQTTHIGGIITANQVSAIRNSGYAPSQASESAIIATLPPGNYTAIVSGVNNTTGVALVDVYDLQ